MCLHAMQEDDYVTEKFGQALVAGSVPVVIGATNIGDYAIAPNSMLVLQTKEVGHACRMASDRCDARCTLLLSHTTPLAIQGDFCMLSESTALL